MNWFFINMVLLAILLVFVGYELWVRFAAKRSATLLTQEEFKSGMRKAQVIDVREKDEFNAGHIMGARNFPMTMLKQSMGSLRKDQPIYIYDQSKTVSVRAASLLKKNGYSNLYILKGGYDDWDGKVKKKKNL